MQEESAALRDRILALEGELRARDQVIREGESRLVQLDSRAKTELAEVQVRLKCRHEPVTCLHHSVLAH